MTDSSAPTCYHCDAPATSREHVPPLCIFPESKDVNGMNLRNNLITVPSCNIHNSCKSHDDEFLMVSIAGIVSNNKLGYIHTKTKISRAVRKKSKEFMGNAIIKNSREKTIVAPNGHNFPLFLGNPDIKRLVKCFESISRGIWFHEFGKAFEGTIKIILGFLLHQKSDNQTFIKFLKRKFELEPNLLELKGCNPEIFTYQFCKPDHFVAVSLKLVFYQGTEIFVALLPIGNPIPYHLGIDLMQKGFQTTFILGNETFEFNKPSS